MEVRNAPLKTKDKEHEEDTQKHDDFWDRRCQEEPGYQGCRIYDL